MIVKGSALRAGRLPGRMSADPFPSAPESGLAMRIVEIGPGDRNPHRHPHSYEAMYVIEGNGQLWENGRIQAVEAGDCILIPSGTPHATVADPGSLMKLVCFFPHPDLASNIQELEGTIDPTGKDTAT